MTNQRLDERNSADAAELAEIDRRAQEIEAERRALTDRRRRLADRMRKRELLALRAPAMRHDEGPAA
jgi:hypothetical protein